MMFLFNNQYHLRLDELWHITAAVRHCSMHFTNIVTV